MQKGEWTSDSAAWQQAWRAVCGVWASKWNDRAWLSRKARGIKEADLKMAVLLQQVTTLKRWPCDVTAHQLSHLVYMCVLNLVGLSLDPVYSHLCVT